LHIFFKQSPQPSNRNNNNNNKKKPKCIFEKHFNISATLETELNDIRVRTAFLFGTVSIAVSDRCEKRSITVTKHTASLSHSLPIPHSWLVSSYFAREAFYSLPAGLQKYFRRQKNRVPQG